LFPTLSQDEKRVLIFADSRQDTAHQAGYSRDRHQTFTQRQIVFRALQDHEEREGLPITLDQLYVEVYTYCRREWQSEADALNLLALTEPEPGDPIGLYTPDENIPAQEVNHAKKRRGKLLVPRALIAHPMDLPKKRKRSKGHIMSFHGGVLAQLSIIWSVALWRDGIPNVLRHL
jgi:hypothetical protein